MNLYAVPPTYYTCVRQCYSAGQKDGRGRGRSGDLKRGICERDRQAAIRGKANAATVEQSKEGKADDAMEMSQLS